MSSCFFAGFFRGEFKTVTPQKSNIDIKNCYLKGSYLFQTIILGIQPLVFGSVYPTKSQHVGFFYRGFPHVWDFSSRCLSTFSTLRTLSVPCVTVWNFGPVANMNEDFTCRHQAMEVKFIQFIINNLWKLGT